MSEKNAIGIAVPRCIGELLLSHSGILTSLPGHGQAAGQSGPTDVPDGDPGRPANDLPTGDRG